MLLLARWGCKGRCDWSTTSQACGTAALRPRLGYAVTAIDSSAILLNELRRLADGLEIRAIEDDLLNFTAHIVTAPTLILCMGDTLTHLSSPDDVELLCSRVAASLAPNGRFVTTFRDYAHPARGDARFIPVRSDADRIHTCFLEEEPNRVLVHDIVHERQGETWAMRISHYPKLRLNPDVVVRSLETHGLNVTRGQGSRGMVQIVAVRPGQAAAKSQRCHPSVAIAHLKSQ